METSPSFAKLRIVECGNLVSAAYGTKLFADLGADVIKVESPTGDSSRSRGPFPPRREGDPEASGLFIYLNSNKRGVTLDFSKEADRRTLKHLLSSADVFLHNLPLAETNRYGLDYDSLEDDLPSLIYASITPFGLSGPRAHWHGENLTVVAASGWASVTPGSSRYPDDPPLKAFGLQADFQAGVNAAVATIGALFARRRTGRGQLVEVSAQECIVSILELAFATYTYTGRVPSRTGIRTRGPMEVMECADGLLFVMTGEPHQWNAFVSMMGHPDWVDLEVFDDPFKRAANADALRPLIEDWLKQHTVDEVFAMAEGHRLPFAPVSTAGDIVNSPHLKARGFFATARQPGMADFLMPGAPYRMQKTPWRLHRPAPALGEHNAEVFSDLEVDSRV